MGKRYVNVCINKHRKKSYSIIPQAPQRTLIVSKIIKFLVLLLLLIRPWQAYRAHRFLQGLISGASDQNYHHHYPQKRSFIPNTNCIICRPMLSLDFCQSWWGVQQAIEYILFQVYYKCPRINGRLHAHFIYFWYNKHFSINLKRKPPFLHQT